MEINFADTTVIEGAVDAYKIVESAVQITQIWLKERPRLVPQNLVKGDTPVVKVDSFGWLKQLPKISKLLIQCAEIIGEVRGLLNINSRAGFNKSLLLKIIRIQEIQINILLLALQRKSDALDARDQLQVILQALKGVQTEAEALESRNVLEHLLEGILEVQENLIKFHAATRIMGNHIMMIRMSHSTAGIRSNLAKASKMRRKWPGYTVRRNRVFFGALISSFGFVAIYHRLLCKEILQIKGFLKSPLMVETIIE